MVDTLEEVVDEAIAVDDVDGARVVAECGARVEFVGVVQAARESPTNTTGPRKRTTRLAVTVFSFTRFGVRWAVLLRGERQGAPRRVTLASGCGAPSIRPRFGEYPPSMRPAVASWILLGVLSLGVGGTSAGAATRHELKGAVQAQPSLSVLPVVPCTTTYGAGSPPSPFVARKLPTTTSIPDLSFYSNGRITVLGPAGWTCGALVAADGGQRLDVYPPGKPDYSIMAAPKGAELIEIQVDYTGHGPGEALVCPLFPGSAVAPVLKESGYRCQKATKERTEQLTPDVVAFTDPPDVTGSGTGSGGSLTSVGAAVYPQLSGGSGASVNVSLLSCTLPRSDLSVCRAIEGDYLVRNAPLYIPQSSS